MKMTLQKTLVSANALPLKHNGANHHRLKFHLNSDGSRDAVKHIRECGAFSVT